MDNKDGTYGVTYNPDEPGNYKVDVVLRGANPLYYDHVGNSPVVVNADGMSTSKKNICTRRTWVRIPAASNIFLILKFIISFFNFYNLLLICLFIHIQLESIPASPSCSVQAWRTECSTRSPLSSSFNPRTEMARTSTDEMAARSSTSKSLTRMETR